MSRLHVALGAVAGTTGGPATYAVRIAAALAARDDLRLTMLTDAPERFADLAVETMHVPMRAGIDRLRWQYWAVGRALRRLNPDVYHDTKNAMPFGVRAARVVTVHDLAYYTVPDTFPWASRAFLRAATTHAVRSADVVLVPSQATADDVAAVYPTKSSCLVVAPHGIDAFARPSEAALREARARLSLPERFVLHVGTLQSRKNVDLVVAGVRRLRDRGVALRAVIVGRVGWHAERTLAELRRDDTALWLEHLPAADLAACYALADAFVSPSAYEGFGLAVADALAAGLPTVIADVSSLPELCGDA
ncbi:MAG: hypothetical protein RL398_452, partial [Planctomycetota bacterium]